MSVSTPLSVAPATFSHPADFYQVRDFGQKWEATAQLIRQHGRPYFATLLRYVAPWLVLSAIIQAAGYITTDGATSNSAFERLGTILERVADVVGTGVTYGFLRARMQAHEDPARPLTVADIWDATANTGSYFGSTIAGGLLVVVGLVLLVLPGIYVYVAMTLLPGVVFMENQGVSRCFELIKGYWWSTFALGLVAGLVMLGIFIVPGVLLGVFISLSGTEPDWTVMFPLQLLAAAALFFVQPVLSVLLAFNYFSIVEAKESPGLELRAARIGAAPALIDTPTDTFYSPEDQAPLR